MVKQTMACLVVVMLALVSVTAFAEPTESPKEQLKKMEGVMAFSKSTVIPLINCFAQNQPHLQFLNGDYPKKGREYINKMDYCLSSHPTRNNDEPELAKVVEGVVNLLQQDKIVGKNYIDTWVSYNVLKDEFNKSKDDDLKIKIDEKKLKIESLKQDLFKSAKAFQVFQKAFKVFNKDFNKRFVVVRKKANK